MMTLSRDASHGYSYLIDYVVVACHGHTIDSIILLLFVVKYGIFNNQSRISMVANLREKDNPLTSTSMEVFSASGVARGTREGCRDLQTQIIIIYECMRTLVSA